MKNLVLGGYGLYRNGASHLQPFLLLFVRVYWGWQFVQTGLGKLGGIPHVIGYFAQLGLPLPHVAAYFTHGWNWPAALF